MTVAPAGMATFAPTAVITPLSKTIVPLGIGADVTGTMVALRMANAGFLPGLFMITDCPNRLPAKNAQVRAMVRRRRTSPGPSLRSGPPSPRFAGRGALDIEGPSPRLRGEEPALSERSESKGAAKRRMRGSELLLILVLRLLRVLVLFRLVVRVFLQAVRLLLRQVFAELQIALAVEDHLALDERGIDARVSREGMAGPDGQVGVLAGVDGADAVIEPELLGWIHRTELERFVFGEAAILHRLRRVEVEAPSQLVGIGVDRSDDAGVLHERHVVRDRVVRLHLVAPPVDEGAAADAVRGNLLGHFVALEHVLQLADLESHLVGDVEQHHD